MMYEVVSKVLNQGELLGYKLKVVKGDNSIKFYTLYDIIHNINAGKMVLKDVKLTKSGNLRGCNGFLLSRVQEESIKDLASVNADLLSVLTFIMKQLYPKPHRDTQYGAEVKGLTAYYFVDTRSENYYNMTHMDATDDLLGTLDFYLEHLPKELEGKVDDISGEVGEKGYLRITVCKKLSV